jgi:hypothetical protein
MHVSVEGNVRVLLCERGIDDLAACWKVFDVVHCAVQKEEVGIDAVGKAIC